MTGNGSGASDESSAPFRAVDTRARRSAGFVYLIMAGVGAAIVIVSGVPAMWATAVVPIAALGVVQVVTAWSMPVGDRRAIEIASEATSFDVGHGSATLGYRGVFARPVWQVLVFSDAPSPDRQALVTVDAMDGAVTGRYEEDVELP